MPENWHRKPSAELPRGLESCSASAPACVSGVAILSEVLIRLFDATAESYKEPLGEVRRALHAGFTEGGDSAGLHDAGELLDACR